MRCELVDSIRTYLQAEDLRHCTQDDLADCLGVPLRTLQWELRRWRVSWSDETRRERRRRLDRLLDKTPKLNTTTAARICGFSGPDAFLVFFKDEIGVTYTECRFRMQRHWEEESCAF